MNGWWRGLYSSDRTDITANILSIYSLFFLILFSISFTYGKGINIPLLNTNSVLIIALISLGIFAAYLLYSRKVFEEMMRKNIWTSFSYICCFSSAVFVYLFYATSEGVKLFPFRNLFFVGYFIVLLMEVFAARTIGSKFVSRRKEGDIVDLLNFHASHFVRGDYLKDLWEEITEKYAPDVDFNRFNPSSRRFDIEDLDENTKIFLCVAMLLGMSDPSSDYRLKTSQEEMKIKIEEVLEEKVLMLPEELRSSFDEKKYYPILYKKTLNRITD
ncbi:MAG: hypothetical protein ACXQTD_07320 [Candidatus Syntropharchaeia archaeon]